jgi:hypothetical protein
MDCFGKFLEECGEGGDFRDRFSDDIKEGLVGDTVELIGEVKEDNCVGWSGTGRLGGVIHISQPGVAWC